MQAKIYPILVGVAEMNQSKSYILYVRGENDKAEKEMECWGGDIFDKGLRRWVMSKHLFGEKFARLMRV